MIKIIIESKSSHTKDYIRACKVDLQTLMSCETIDDVNNAQWETADYNRIINKHIDKGYSIEDAIEKEVDNLMDLIKTLKSNYTHEVEYEEEIPAVVSKLHDALDNKYSLLSETGDKITYEPVENASHKDCIKFVDDVVSAVDGKYSGTGRGGSWTMWDILTDTGIRLKAGWNQDDNWEIIIQ